MAYKIMLTTIKALSVRVMRNCLCATQNTVIEFESPFSLRKTLVVNSMYSTSDNNKIFNSVIIFNSIDMMNNLGGSKISAKVLLHSKTASFNITSIIMRVLRTVNKYIFSFVNFSPLPPRSLISNHKFTSDFLRVTSFITFVSVVLKKLPLTSTQTNFFNNKSHLFSHFNIILQRRVYNNV